ncbi:MAG: nucleotidyltransferase domain-containing protein [bacterium]
MLFHRPLDEALAAWSHLAVLRALQDAALGMTGRELARQAGLSHRACHNALTRLEQLHLVQRQRGGQSHLFTLRRDHRLMQEALLPMLVVEREFFSSFCDVLRKKIRNPVVALIIFGSVARKDESPESDVDLCVIVKRPGDKVAAQAAVHQLAPTMLRRFGAKLAPIFFTLAEFRRRARSQSGAKPPVNSILREGVVVRGPSLRELAYG